MIETQLPLLDKKLTRRTTPKRPAQPFKPYPTHFHFYPLHQLTHFIRQSVLSDDLPHLQKILAFLRTLPDKHSLITILDSDANTLPNLAAAHNHFKLFKLLLNYEAQLSRPKALTRWLEQRNHSQYAPADYAAYFGSTEILEMLHGHNVNLVDLSSRLPISYAAQNDHVKVVAYMRVIDVPVFQVDHTQSTVLHWACYYGSEEVVYLLLNWNQKEHAKVIDLQDERGMTALHLAVLAGNPKVVRMLIEKGANTQVRNQQYKTAEDLASKSMAHLFRKQNFFLDSWNLKSSVKKAQKQYWQLFLVSIVFMYCTILTIFLTFPFIDSAPVQVLTIILSLLVILLYSLILLIDPGYYSVSNDNSTLYHLLQENPASAVCTYCIIKRPERSFHCEICQRCVKVHDHHCFWINNCVRPYSTMNFQIGSRNKLLYMIFMTILILDLLNKLLLNVCFIKDQHIYVQKRWRTKTTTNNYYAYNIFVTFLYIHSKIQLTVISILIAVLVPVLYIFIHKIKNLSRGLTYHEAIKHPDAQVSLQNCVDMCCLNHYNPQYD